MTLLLKLYWCISAALGVSFLLATLNAMHNVRTALLSVESQSADEVVDHVSSVADQAWLFGLISAVAFATMFTAAVILFWSGRRRTLT